MLARSWRRPGVTWFPAAAAEPASTLLAPGERASRRSSCRSRPSSPATYRGALILQGFRDGGIPVAIEAEAPRAAPAKRPSRRRATAPGPARAARSDPAADRVRLVDAPEEAGRTRRRCSPRSPPGSARSTSSPAPTRSARSPPASPRLGREVAGTAAGRTLRQALEAGRAGTNGERLWSALRIGDWASRLPPSAGARPAPQRLALLLADDLEPTLELLPIPARAGRRGPRSSRRPRRSSTSRSGSGRSRVEVVRRGRGARRGRRSTGPPVVAATRTPRPSAGGRAAAVISADAAPRRPRPSTRSAARTRTGCT